MSPFAAHFKGWWGALLNAEAAGAAVLGRDVPEGFTRFLVAAVAGLYAIYGASMGLFLGVYPAAVSALKLPLLFFLTLAVCFPAFYVLNGTSGPRLPVYGCVRLLLLAASGNAIALASYAPVSFFFTLTTSRQGYLFIALMHVAVFAVSGATSVAVIAFVFRSAAAQLTRPIRATVALSWGLLYALVGTEMAWTLRPWIGWWGEAYTPFRPLGRSFIEALWFMLTRL